MRELQAHDILSRTGLYQTHMNPRVVDGCVAMVLFALAFILILKIDRTITPRTPPHPLAARNNLQRPPRAEPKQVAATRIARALPRNAPRPAPHSPKRTTHRRIARPQQDLPRA